MKRAIAWLALAVAAQAQSASDFELWTLTQSRESIAVACDAKAPPLVRRAAERLAERLRATDARPVRRIDGLPSKGNALLCVVGTFSDPTLRAAIPAPKRFSWTDGGVAVGGIALQGQTDALVVFDEAGGSPVLALLAGAPGTLGRLAGEVTFPERPGVRALRDGERPGWAEAIGPLAERFESGIRWRWRGVGSEPPVPPERRLALARDREQALQSLFELTGSFPADAVEVVLYPSLAEKARLTGDCRPVHANRVAGRLHAVESDGQSSLSGADCALLAIDTELGVAARGWLEAGAMHHVRTAGRDAKVRVTEAKLLRQLAAQPIEAILGEGAIGRRSPRIVSAAAGRMVAALARQLGTDRFRSFYQRSEDLPAQAPLEDVWKSLFSEPRELPRSAPSGPTPERPWAGFQLPESVDPAAGAFGSAQWDAVASAGANAVLLTVHRNLDAGGRAAAAAYDDTLGAESASPRRWLESEIAAAAVAARARGLAVALRTRFVGVESDQWFGEQFGRSDAERARAFERLQESLLHDALLAEEIGASLLFVGVELRGMSYSKESAECWSRNLEALKEITDIPLTYGASWRRVAGKTRPGTREEDFAYEPQVVSFWPQMDLFSMAGDFPLETRAGAANDGELLSEARRRLDILSGLAATQQKGFLITDVGYVPTKGAAVTPWRRNGERSPLSATRAWRAFCEALSGRERMCGVFVDAWPTEATLALAGRAARVVGAHAAADVDRLLLPARPR
ncbi:MAG: hypothetical protein JNJ88_10150 [Planctomycetes bacterium]|nr:hypothetical protein [Planctomycetota bacterium]